MGMEPPGMEYDELGRPKAPTFKRHTFDVPDHLFNIKQNDIVKLQKKFDLLVIYVGHPMYCSGPCIDYFEDFKQTAKEVVADVGGHGKRLIGAEVADTIKFAFLNAEQEGDEYTGAIGGDFYEGQDFPQILIMKADHQLARKPPITFAVTDQVPFRLPKFLMRLAGKSPAKVTTEEQLMSRISHKATERVSIGIWSDTLPYAVEEVAFEERFLVLFHHLPSPDSADKTLMQKYNPHKADIVVYFYKPATFNMERIGETTAIDTVIQMDHVSFNKTIVGERRIHDHQHRLLKRLLEVWGQYQPGREFERIKKITIQNSSNVPENCDDRRAKAGDRIIARVIGRITLSGRSFTDSRDDTFIVGDVARIDIPKYIMANGFTGMCAGMKRRIGFPPNFAYPPELRPTSIGEKERVTFHIHLLKFLEEGEEGPDNRKPEYEDTNDPEGEL
eukprot:GILI01031635.1.p1 GENE.GILI01031635.1~~GILI01031635.1.p1  ORF type:complete len:483 (+),score=126.55 GILI01031635.1:115-1449(+)